MPDSRFTFGPYVFDPVTATLWRDGTLLPIGARGAAVLQALLEADKGVVTKSDLMERAWPGTIVEEGNLAVQIATLRKSLGTTPDGDEWIASVPRVGYRLVRPPEAFASTFDGKPSIAVLPFSTFDSNVDQSHFADGLVEELITALSRFKTFAVVSRNSSFVYKDRAIDVRDVATALGVRYVLEGSVRRAGTQIRVSAQLIDAQSGSHIWAETFDGLVDNVLDAQDRITERVIASIEPHIDKAEIARARRKRPDSLDAYDLYLQALPLVHDIVLEGYSQALALLDRAIALDPHFAPALALASFAHDKRQFRGGTSPPGVDDVARACELAERALAADDSDAIVLVRAGTQIMLHKRETDRGFALMMRGLELNPNSTLVLDLAAFAHRFRGNYDDAIACHLRALKLVPGPLEEMWCVAGIANGHLSAGRFEEALVWAQRSLERSTELDQTYMVLAAAYALLGRAQEAEQALQTLLSIRPEASLARFYGPDRTPHPADTFLAEGLRKAGLAASRQN